MAVSPQDIKTLREMTGAGLMDCKKALAETDGNMDNAVDWLRKNGLSKAAKKEGRISAEGLVSMSISDDFTSATLSEVNSETDFVAKNDRFIKLTQNTVNHIQATSSINTVEELTSSTINGTVFDEYFKTEAATIGENLVTRRFTKISLDGNGAINGYIHSNGRIGVLVAAVCDSQTTAKGALELLKQIAMHAAAMNPAYLDATKIPAEDIAREMDIAKELLLKEGKPENIIEKILIGKENKFKEETTLVGQMFIMDDKKSIQTVINEKAKELGGSIQLVEFVRYEVGEGIEKKEDNFADEVAAALK